MTLLAGRPKEYPKLARATDDAACRPFLPFVAAAGDWWLVTGNAPATRRAWRRARVNVPRTAAAYAEEAVVVLDGVTRRFEAGNPALDSVSLQVLPGESVAVLGPSGSGKSTLLNLVAGLDRPTAGQVVVAGRRVDRLGEAQSARFRRAEIGLVFQFFHLLDELTVLENTALPARLAGMARGTAVERAQTLLDRLGVGRHARAYPTRLSGGERQRVAVARALVNRPALLLADEPTGALDTASGEDVKALLQELHQEEGQTIIMVTHDASLARSYASRLIRLVDGRIASDVPVLPAAPADPGAPSGAFR
jgi:putative ABC transport system ATP-binding protein